MGLRLSSEQWREISSHSQGQFMRIKNAINQIVIVMKYSYLEWWLFEYFRKHALDGMEEYECV